MKDSGLLRAGGGPTAPQRKAPGCCLRGEATLRLSSGSWRTQTDALWGQKLETTIGYRVGDPACLSFPTLGALTANRPRPQSADSWDSRARLGLGPTRPPTLPQI